MSNAQGFALYLTSLLCAEIVSGAVGGVVGILAGLVSGVAVAWLLGTVAGREERKEA